MAPPRKYVTQESFNSFVENDFAHVKVDVEKVKSKLGFVRGQLTLLIPLVFAILAIVTSVLIKLIKG